MSYELFAIDGKRKYLTSEEWDCFLAFANQNERGEVRILCLVMACRISEALELMADKIDLSALSSNVNKSPGWSTGLKPIFF